MFASSSTCRFLFASLFAFSPALFLTLFWFVFQLSVETPYAALTYNDPHNKTNYIGCEHQHYNESPRIHDGRCNFLWFVELVMRTDEECGPMRVNQRDVGIPICIVALNFVPCIGKWKSFSSRKLFLASTKPLCNDLVLLLPAKFMVGVSPCRQSLQQNWTAWFSMSGNIPTALLLSRVVYGVSCHQLVVNSRRQLHVSEMKVESNNCEMHVW